MLKHIHTYSQYLVEQGMDPMSAMPAEPVAPIKKEKPVYFIFLDDSESSDKDRKKYPDGSSEIDFPTYSILPSQMKEWCDKNILSTDKNKLNDSVLTMRRENLLNIVTGDRVNISKEDIPFIEKLKNAVSTDIFGKREPDTTVVFTSDNIPTTEDVKVTFIKYKK